MRKISIILYSFLILSFIACEDQLDQAPISEVGSNNFYRNEADFQKAITGVYSQLRFYPDRHFYLSEVRSDNLYATTAMGVREHEPINNFEQTIAVNNNLENAWNQSFNGIMRANTVLTKLNDQVVPNEAIRQQIEGEAKFLRALYYFDLLRWFGKIPLYDKVISPTEALEIPRSSVQDVYGLIMADLADAITLLPPSYDAVDVGRATSWAAKALLARVHLTRSGPTYNIEGPGLGLNEYAQALNLLNDIIDNGPYAWVSDYASIFDYNNENNPDIIFDVQYISGGLGAGALYPGIMIPQAYGRAVQLPFDPGGIELIPVSDDFLNSFEEGDVRKEASFQLGYTDQGFVETRAFYNKFLDLQQPGLDRFDWPINFPVIRYTDVLMMKAEAILHGAGGSQQEVDDIVNRVRERAGLEAVSEVTLPMLMEERRKEFAVEGLRWHDLVRSGLVLDAMNEWLPIADELNRMPETLDPNYVIYPLPYTQLIVKKGLYQQNPGY
jgi:hypothetical protein